jgi:hypothetical protein
LTFQKNFRLAATHRNGSLARLCTRICARMTMFLLASREDDSNRQK